jgi:hypothetical protein
MKKKEEITKEPSKIELFFKVKNALRKYKPGTFEKLISIAFPYPVHWGVAAIWDKKRSENNPAKLWIADCGDPYMLQENDTFTPVFYFGWVEKWFCKKIDYLSVPTEKSYIPLLFCLCE